MTKSTNNRSTAYIGTINNDPAGLAEYEAIKKEVREFNKAQREIAARDGTLPQIKKVDSFARLGKNSPHAQFYKNITAARKGLYYGPNPYQRINKEHAATLDVYVNHFRKVNPASFNHRSLISIL